MCDVDRFKAINDTLGHVLGDRVLSRVAERLSGAIRRDDPFGRWGGEEFLAIVSAQSTPELFATADGMRAAVSRRPIEGLAVTTSIGAALSSALTPASALVEAADAALYDAKRAGRNCTRTSTDRAAITPRLSYSSVRRADA